MDTRLLKIFRSIARNGGLSKAAVELHLTPSALSHGLKALETEVGCRLFERVGRKLVLNQAGEHLLSGIEGPMAAIERTAETLQEIRRWGQGRLRIGVSSTIAQHLLPSVLKDLHTQFPRLDLLIETGDTPDLVKLLREQRIDLALGVDDVGTPEMETRPLFEDELLLIVAARHALAEGGAVSRLDMRKQTLILYRRTSPTVRSIQQHLQDHQIEPGKVLEVADISTIKQMVAMELGVTIMAPWTIEAELTRRKLTARPISSKPLKRKWSMILKAERRLNLAEEKLCELCRRHARGLRLDRKDLPLAAA